MSQIDWRQHVRIDSRHKIANAEARLNDTIQNLMTKWVAEGAYIQDIKRRLDVSDKLVYKLIDVFGLRDNATKNAAKIKKGAYRRITAGSGVNEK